MNNSLDTTDGDFTQVYVWGDDQFGQLGIGKRTKKFCQSPKICSFNIKISQIACGETHSAILAEGGHVYSMGSNLHGELGLGTKVAQGES